MDHNFISSQLDTSKCARCKYTQIDHTNGATCEACGNTGTVELFTDMLLCMDCVEQEKKAILAYQSAEKQDERARLHNEQISKDIIERSKRIDASIHVKTDLFNAETVAITELFQAVDSDVDIANKLFEKARLLKDRFDHFQKVIFDARSVLEQATNSQRAIQTQLNELALKLRQDEREKLKIQDINYRPEPPKKIKAASKKPTEKKWTKSDVREAAADFKVPVDAVQMICVARNMHPKDAAYMLAQQIHGEVK